MIETQPNPPTFESYRENQSNKGKLRNIARRLFRFVRRPKPIHLGIEQPFDPVKMIEAEKEVNPTRAEKMSEKGCAVRAIMSAAAHALEMKQITAEPDEWDARFKQFEARERLEKARKFDQINDVYEELIALYEGYSQNDTPLGNALKQVTLAVKKEQTVEQITEMILSGEQVLIHNDAYSLDKSHIFHAGVEERGRRRKKYRITSLSDQKIQGSGKRAYYQRPPLAGRTFTVITVAKNQT